MKSQSANWYGVTTDGVGCVTHLELEDNELRGEIPAVLGSIANLKVLNLRENSLLSGQIPSELGNLSNLEYLDFSDQTGQSDTYSLVEWGDTAGIGQSR